MGDFISGKIQPRWLKLADACRYSGMSRNTIKAMLKDGVLTGETTPGGHWRVDRESIDRYFSRGEQQALALVRSLEL